ncbi:hypothetical protein ANANG_G00313010 [Anguilla anguilla]|uniref:Uncharacterized protein n=1 Tax=Anguilla anguilla TaxID=7936 RepID=A0A9D3LHC8_ANGAN|nr:hypothetical protein ANANG_G00313010 [Anguilla anguilla]
MRLPGLGCIWALRHCLHWAEVFWTGVSPLLQPASCSPLPSRSPAEAFRCVSAM